MQRLISYILAACLTVPFTACSKPKAGNATGSITMTEAEAEDNINRTDSATCGGMKRLHLANARCEYQLGNQGDNSYHPRNMIDGKSSTAWAAKLDLINDDFENGIIVGPMFDVSGSEAIAGVSLMNGYCKSSSSFNNNTRASWVTIYRYHPEFDGETAEDQMMGFINAADIIYDGPIADNMESQFFPTNVTFDNSKPTHTVGLLFKKGHFHRGAKWNDLCISEIEVFGK